MARTRSIRDEDLLEAARACFIESGFAVATKTIAKRAGVSEGILFQRYATKADLFFAAMVPPEANISEKMRNVPADPAERRLHVRAVGLLLIDYFRAAVPILLPLVSHPAFRFEEFAAAHPNTPLVTLRREAMAYFRQLEVPDPAGSALLLLSSTYGMVMFERLGAHDGRMPPEFVNRMLDQIYPSR